MKSGGNRHLAEERNQEVDEITEDEEAHYSSVHHQRDDEAQK